MNQEIPIGDILIFSTAFVLFNGLYCGLTKRTITIKPHSKYIIVANRVPWRINKSRLMIGSSTRQYEVCKNIWFKQWDSMQKWDAIKCGKEYTVIAYGMYLPVFNIYPKVILA